MLCRIHTLNDIALNAILNGLITYTGSTHGLLCLKCLKNISSAQLFCASGKWRIQAHVEQILIWYKGTQKQMLVTYLYLWGLTITTDHGIIFFNFFNRGCSYKKQFTSIRCHIMINHWHVYNNNVLTKSSDSE